MEYILRLSSVFVIIFLAFKDASTETLHSVAQPLRNQCQVRYCNNMSSENNIGCKCDDSCWRRRDCCLNYLNQTNVDNQTYYFDIPNEVIERGQLYQCYAMNQDETNGHSVISKCGDYGKVITESWKWQKSQCEKEIQQENANDILLRIPVSSNNTGETYKNIYCAACHNDSEVVVSWKTTAACTKESHVSNITEFLQNLYVNDSSQQPICRLKVVPPNDIETFQCSLITTNSISTCPQSFDNTSTSSEDADMMREIEWLCQVTSNRVNVNGTNYKSPYCAACHINETDVGAVINSKHGFCSTFSSPVMIATTRKSFAVLLDIDFSFNKGNMVGLSYQCPSGSIYDVFTNKCRLLFCSTGYHYHAGQCKKQGEMENTEFMVGNISSNHSHEKLVENETAVNISNCLTKRLERFEFIINDNGTLTAHQQKLYPKGTFELIDNDTVYVCALDLSDNNVFSYDGDIHVYMTIICSSLSLIALLIKITIFILISEIRKFPDKSVFCLCTSLFIAQLLFLIATSSITIYPVCASIGVLTHYFFLSSFCWMNVLAYDISNTLSQCIESRLIHSDILKCRFYCYSLYAWVTPIVIVSTACVFEWSGIVDESSIMRSHYGDLCWISRRTALLFYFAIPMALLLLSNIIFFVLTFVSICRSSRASSTIQSTENSKNCCHNHNRSPHLRFSIYVRLALIMGLTWISGFVAAYSGQDWLWYVFIFTNASQGVYILFALTSFKKVLQILQRGLQTQGKNSFSSFVINFNIGNNSKQS